MLLNNQTVEPRAELGNQLNVAKDSEHRVSYSSSNETELYNYMKNSDVWYDATSDQQNWDGFTTFANSNDTAKVTFSPMDEVIFTILSF